MYLTEKFGQKRLSGCGCNNPKKYSPLDYKKSVEKYCEAEDDALKLL